MTDKIEVVHINRRLPDNSIYRLGTCIRYVDGWRFISNHQAHRSGRKYWPSWETCVPRWCGCLYEAERVKVTSLMDKPITTSEECPA